MPYKRTKARKQKKANQIKKKFLIIACGVLTLGVLLLGSLQLSFWRIDSILINGLSAENEVLVRQDIQSIMKGAHYYVLPYDHIAFIPKKKIQDSISGKFLSVENIKVSRTGLREISLSVTTRVPVITFCNEAEPGLGCYAIDKRGFLYAEKLARSENIQEFRINTVVYSSYKNYIQGDTFLGEQILGELRILVDSVSKKNIKIVSVYEYSPLSIIIQTVGGSRIVIPKESQYDQIYSTIVKLLSLPEFAVNKERQDFESDIAYINLGLGNKIFYCLGGEICATNY